MIVNKYKGNSGGGGDMSGYTTTATTAELSAATSGIAVDLETLSAYTENIPISAENYKIVSNLSEITDPFEGLVAYVQSGSTNVNFSGYTIDTAGLTGNGKVIYQGNPNDNYNFNYDGQGGVQIFDEANINWFAVTSAYTYLKNCIYIKLDNGIIYCTYQPGRTIWQQTGVLENVTLGEFETTIPVPYNGRAYRYQNGQWLDMDIFIVKQSQTNEERAAIYSKLMAIRDELNDYPDLLANVYSRVWVEHFPCINVDYANSSPYTINFYFFDNGGTLAIYKVFSDGTLYTYHYANLISVSSDLRTLSATTSGIAVDVETLSATTSGIAVDVETLSATTSGIAVDVETLSGSVQTVSVQQELSAGTKIATVSIDGTDTDLYAPEMPTASDTTLGGVKVGSGLTINNSGVLSTQPNVVLTQAQYDALVQAGTVDPNTIYTVV